MARADGSSRGMPIQAEASIGGTEADLSVISASKSRFTPASIALGRYNEDGTVARIAGASGADAFPILCDQGFAFDRAGAPCEEDHINSIAVVARSICESGGTRSGRSSPG